jgi:diketogulonate reductase-like aldo/keto reductase
MDSQQNNIGVKRFGRTNIMLPELGIGTWQYTGGIAVLRAAIELGVRLVDTAESYGSEKIVGEAIKGIREQVFLASKVSPRHFRYNDLIGAAEGSLKRLGTDYLDLYQLHWPNYTVPLEETLSAMVKLVETGKIRFIGVSNFSVSELRRAQKLLGPTLIGSNQVRYNLVDRTPEDTLLNHCSNAGVSLLAFSPLASGIDNVRSADMNDVLRRLAKSYDKTPAQVALNWCLSHHNVIAIFKTDRIERVHENCAASGWSLTDEDCALLKREVRSRSRGRAEQFARRCARRFVQYTGRNLGGETR